MDRLRQDVRYAARTFRRSPIFALSAVLTIALGIGGGTAIFSVVNTVLLRPLPFADGERLVRVQQTVARPDGGTGRVGMSQLNFVALRERSRVIESAVAHRFRSLTTSGDGEPERLIGIQVSDGWLPTTGIRPLLGRGFSAEEERAGGDARVVVISHGLWVRRFGVASDIVGRSLRLNGAAHTIVGVMPRGYAYPYRAELWLPLPLDRTSGAPRDLNVTARLRAGVSAAQVDRELRELGRQFARETAANREMAGLVAIPMRTELVGDFRAVLQALVAAVGLVLLIACVNVSNLLLARSTARRREFGIRGALGASRGRQIQQLLTESMLLAAAGGAIGLALTLVGTETLAALIPENMRDVLPAVRIDAAVLAFATLLPLVTGLVFGLAPALRTWSPNLVDALKDGGRGSGAGGLRLLHALVVAEIAVALVLLSGGALLLRDLQRRFAANLGVRTDGVVTMNVAFPEREYAAATARAQFVRQVEERLAALPGVHAAGAATIIPFGSGNTLTSVEIDGRPGDAPPTVNHRLVTPGFFPAMGIRLVRGRLLGPEDDAASAPTAVVSEALARRYWPGEDPIGKRLRQRGNDHGWRTVVGVVGNVAEREIPETWYLPYAQGAPYMPVSWATLRIVLVVRATGDLAAIVPAMRRAVSETDANVPVFDVATLRRLHVEGLGEQRLSAVLTGSLAALGLVLATLGIYGVVSYAVSRRNREIGIRMAVGADTSMVLRHELSRSGALVLGGLGLGLVGTFALTRYMAGLLAEIEPRDPLSLGVVMLLLSVVGTLAAYIPARRAANVDPLIVLRPE